MNSTPFFVDIHIHPSIKSSNWTTKDGVKNPWESFEHIKPTTSAARWGSIASKAMAKYTQTNFYKLIEGKVRVASISLYPLERGFSDIRNLPKFLASKKGLTEMLAIGSGFGLDKAAHFEKTCNYYKELKEEYKFLKKHEGKSPCGKYSYKLVSDYSELQESLKKENELAIILSVEGCHSLFDKEMWSGNLDRPTLKARLTKNIEDIKSWDNPPFFMNLMHHFDNKLGGHARSFKVGIGMALLNQRKGLEQGLNGLGIKVLKELLTNQNGKRIHIDVKHMSLKARKEYYRWIRSYNYLNKYDTIPVICSHSGVNGFKSMTGSLLKPDNGAKNSKSYFFNWSINTSDEELKIIHETKGVVGLIIDKGKLGGGGFLKKAEKEKDAAKLKDLYMKLIWDNLFQASRAIGNKTAWDIFTLGTDFDGAINHVEQYNDATQLPFLYKDLYEYLDRTKYEKALWYGYKPEELLDKIFRKNGMDFLERNFV